MQEYLELIKIVANLGGSAVIAVVIIICVFKLLVRFGTVLSDIGQAFVEAHQQIAKAVSEQAGSMNEMKTAVEKFIGKDNSEHREIILGMQVVGDELKSLVCEIKNLREGR